MPRITRIIVFDGRSGTRTGSTSKLEECAKCGGDFYLGEMIVSKPSGSHKTKRYHKKCAEVCHII